ncbi:MAG TPA: HAMP domain-containing sensor histidine kinase [Acidimicrobiales bacterium]|nr:HAMP domain-containing sensor histidine kinase [Acidimicrobiales bacterium]
MRRRLVLSYVTVAAVILIALEVPLSVVYSRHEHDAATAGVVRDATALASLADDGVERGIAVDLQAVAAQYRTAASGDVVIIDREGRVLVPARGAGSELAGPAVREQLDRVLHGAPSGIRAVPHADELVALAPIGSADSPAGAVAVASSDERVDQRVHRATLALFGLAGAVLVAVAALGLVVARSVTRPLTHLEGAARRLGSGELATRAPEGEGPAEVRTLSREFNSMAARLEELVVAQRGFVADASHQLRSPLTALRLRLENITAGFPSAEADVDAVLAELDRLSRVVDGLLVLARSDAQRPERAAVDVAAVAADRFDAWSALAEEGGIRLVASGLDNGPVLGSLVPGHLEQILDNLLANALEATPAGKAVQLSVGQRDGWAEVHVTDEGTGMSEQERRRAFDRFWRGPRSRPGSGSGLGLSIVSQLARVSGAEVELLEASGGGVDAVVRTRTAPAREPRAARDRTEADAPYR